MEPQSEWGKRKLAYLRKKHQQDIEEAERLIQETKEMLNRGTVA